MAILYEACSADDVWQSAFNLVLEQGELQASRSGSTLELLNVSLNIKNVRNRWVVSRCPAISPAFAIAEVFWILSGSNSSSFINFWNPSLPKFSGTGSTYHGAYGYRLRKHFSIDQLYRAYSALSNNPESRQVVLSLYDPKYDLPNEFGKAVAQDIPCNTTSLLKVRNGRLYWSQVLRSNDLMLGTPYNFIQFTILQEILAGWIGCDVGDYFHFANSLHVYEQSLDKYKCEISSFDYEPEDLRLNFEKSDEVIKLVFNFLNFLVNFQENKDELKSNLESLESLPSSYRSLVDMCILYAARKWKDERILEGLAGSKSGYMNFLWKSWLSSQSF